jgi:hypothetical protein
MPAAAKVNKETPLWGVIYCLLKLHNPIKDNTVCGASMHYP